MLDPMIYSTLNFLKKPFLFKEIFSTNPLCQEEVIGASCFRQAVFTMASLAISSLADVRAESLCSDLTGHIFNQPVSSG